MDMRLPASTSTDQGLSLDSRNLEGLKKGARAKAGTEEHSDAINKVAVQFESVFLQMALKSMREALPEGGLFSDSSTKMYQSMYDQEIVQHLSGKGLGLAQEIARQLKQQSGLTPQNGQPSTLGKQDR